MRLDIGDYEEKPTDKIEGFYERLAEVMPSLVSHGCSYQEEGGFLRRVEEGTWAGHVIEHFALELQTLAGMDVGYGRTRETGEKGIYNVVFTYHEEEVGRYAARAAVALFLDLAEGKTGRRNQADTRRRRAGNARDSRGSALRPFDRLDRRRSRNARHSVYSSQRPIARPARLRRSSAAHSGDDDRPKRI